MANIAPVTATKAQPLSVETMTNASGSLKSTPATRSLRAIHQRDPLDCPEHAGNTITQGNPEDLADDIPEHDGSGRKLGWTTPLTAHPVSTPANGDDTPIVGSERAPARNQRYSRRIRPCAYTTRSSANGIPHLGWSEVQSEQASGDHCSDRATAPGHGARRLRTGCPLE